MSKPRLLGAVKTAPTKADKFNLRYQRNQQKKAVSKQKKVRNEYEPQP